MNETERSSSDAGQGGVPGFQQQLKEHVKGATSWRQLSKATTISPSTLTSWLGPDNQPMHKLISEENLRELLTKAGKAAEIESWVQRRNQAEPQLGGGDHAGGDHRGGERDSGVRQEPRTLTLSTRSAVLGLMVLVVALGGGGMMVGMWVGSSSDSESAMQTGSTSSEAAEASERTEPEPCGELPLDFRPAVVAHIQDTFGRGARIWGEPSRDSCAAGALSEGQEIEVVCLELDGEPIDEKIDGKPIQTTAWAKMSSGAYVLSLYTDLPYTDGGELVAGLSAC